MADQQTLGKLLTVKEVANLLGISVRSVWRLNASGELVGVRPVGRATRWRLCDLEKYIARLK